MNQTQLAVLGAGPGGYACAFRAADLGLHVLLVEPNPDLGGVCLNEGCIPSKALLHVAAVIREVSCLKRMGIHFGELDIDLDTLRQGKNGIVSNLTNGLVQLAKRRNVTVKHALGQFIDSHNIRVGKEQWRFDNAVIATGSNAVQFPDWPSGHPNIWDSTKALETPSIPKQLAIVGGGIIGLEMATIYSALGAQVQVIELANSLLAGVNTNAVQELQSSMQERGVKFVLGTSVDAIDAKSDDMLALKLSNGTHIYADVVLQCVGRKANGASVAPASARIDCSNAGVIAVDAQGKTNVANIFAIGDVTGMPMLAHRASHQGKVTAEVIAGHKASFDHSLIPSVAYTDPELAWVGHTLVQAKSLGIDAAETSFPWTASGRNLAQGGSGGMTSLVYCKKTQRIIGGTIVGTNAGELLAEVSLAIEMGALLTDVALTIHAHPTLSETIAFAAEKALGTLTDL